jgi:hypothetical protein
VSRGTRDTASLFVAVPTIVLALSCVVLTGLGLFDRNPFWAADDLTMSEAAALRDPATVLLQLEQGQDPLQRYSVRSGLLGPDALRLTPMEAAIREDRIEVAAVLLRGAVPPFEQLCKWLTLAAAERAEELREYLYRKYPTESAACGPLRNP